MGCAGTARSADLLEGLAPAGGHTRHKPKRFAGAVSANHTLASFISGTRRFLPHRPVARRRGLMITEVTRPRVFVRLDGNTYSIAVSPAELEVIESEA